jgi:soluble lytic murein transglycosylase-like protein
MVRIVIAAAVILCAALPAREARAQAPAPATRCRVDPDRLWFVTEAAADLAGIDPDLLTAIAWVESRDCDRAVSPKGAAGLMQLMPETAARFGVVDPFDPGQSALAGAKFIAELERNGGLPLAQLLAAYNAGPAAVVRYGGVPPYAETRDYVRAVLMLYLTDSTVPTAPRPSYPAAHAVHRSSSPPPTDNDAEIFAQLSQIRGARARSQPAAAQP